MILAGKAPDEKKADKRQNAGKKKPGGKDRAQTNINEVIVTNNNTNCNTARLAEYRLAQVVAA